MTCSLCGKPTVGVFNDHGRGQINVGLLCCTPPEWLSGHAVGAKQEAVREDLAMRIVGMGLR